MLIETVPVELTLRRTLIAGFAGDLTALTGQVDHQAACHQAPNMTNAVGHRRHSLGVPTPAMALSPRESGVLLLICRGLSNKDIARELQIAPETVKSHAKHILLKLNARTRAEAVARAAGFGLVA
jgi:DNA-binding NarL/FixJ family response regulator